MELLERARQWASHDPDPATASSLSADIEAAQRGDEEAAARVGAAMNGPLQFGTAGLRGVVGPGESRMNLAVVIRATAGLCEVVKRHATGTPTLVVGCDARYGSSEFATAACRVASAAGVRVLALPQANPTPLTSFSMLHFDADAGVMVTASHNPAPDNGYKVYLGGTVAQGDGRGVQIVPPFDAEIAAAIEAAPPADEVPMNDDLIEAVDPREEYVACASALASGEAPAREDLRIVLTAMHGVGAAITSRVLAEAGFSNVSLVAAQADPDPDFPTVPFPNPEEAGALDMAMEQAREEGADLIIAVDPDADRCALAVPDPTSETGWSPLSGDQIGSLLGEFLASRGLRGSLANSIVSSRLLSRIASAHGLEHHTTLTGFKWIARAPGLGFGYEEAIGFCPDPAQRARQRWHRDLGCRRLPGGRPQGAGAQRVGRAGASGATARPARELAADLPRRADRADRRRHGAPACPAAERPGWFSRRRGLGPVAGVPWPAAHGRRPGAHRGGGSRHRAPLGHRAKAQVLPRGDPAGRRGGAAALGAGA